MRRVVPALLIYFSGIVLLSIFLTPPAYWAVDHFWTGHVPVKRVFNRILMLSALALLWPLLCGLRATGLRVWGLDFRKESLRLFLPWCGLGVLTLILLTGGQLLAGALHWQPVLKWHELLLFALSGLLVGVLEEPLFRGVFFLAFVRPGQQLQNAGLALLSSIFFATSHFIKAQNPALPVTWGSGFDIWREIGTHLASPSEFFMNWMTLLLVGLVLCAVVYRQGHIWGATGLHAGWVWALKCSGKLGTTGVSDFPHWFPPHLLSGLGADLLLLLLLGLLVFWPRHERMDR